MLCIKCTATLASDRSSSEYHAKTRPAMLFTPPDLRLEAHAWVHPNLHSPPAARSSHYDALKRRKGLARKLGNRVRQGGSRRCRGFARLCGCFVASKPPPPSRLVLQGLFSERSEASCRPYSHRRPERPPHDGHLGVHVRIPASSHPRIQTLGV